MIFFSFVCSIVIGHNAISICLRCMWLIHGFQTPDRDSLCLLGCCRYGFFFLRIPGIPGVEAYIDGHHDQVEDIEPDNHVEAVEKLVEYAGQVAYFDDEHKHQAFALDGLGDI